MPEPDFDQIAREMIKGLLVLDVPAHLWEAFAKDHAEQLRQVWNARGAADRAAVEQLAQSWEHNAEQPMTPPIIPSTRSTLYFCADDLQRLGRSFSLTPDEEASSVPFTIP